MYSSFTSAQLQLDGLLALDFYLAKQVCDALSQQDNELLLHSVMAVSAALRDGHTCLQLDKLAGQTLWLNSNLDRPGYCFPELEVWSGVLAELDVTPETEQPIVYDLQRLYLRRYWQFETELSDRMGQMLTATQVLDLDKARQVMEKLFDNPQASQDAHPIDWQKLAVANALGRRFTIIAGGPGTGKTFTVTRLLAALQELSDDPMTICMATPTGKAAQRLKASVIDAKAQLAKQGHVSQEALDAIPETASTLHRLLGVIRGSNNYRHHQNNLLDLDLLLVDEVSMIDLPLMTRLLRALPPSARVIMLGDADQLPSVAAGSVLADLAPLPHPGYSAANVQQLKTITGTSLPSNEKAMNHLCVLEKSHRFVGDGGIGRLAKQVIKGEAEASWASLTQGSEQTQLIADVEFQQWLTGLVDEYYGPVLQAEQIEQAFAALARFRFLAGTRIGPYGIEQLNGEIEQHLRRRGAISSSGPYYKGRPVMVTENHYELGLFNGDVGLIWPHSTGRLQAVFEGAEHKLRWVTVGRLPAVETVFAMTIHKTQGSEFEHVALVLPEQETPMLSRELIYTGITRARERLTLWANKPVWLAGIEKRIERYSGLSARLFRD